MAIVGAAIIFGAYSYNKSYNKSHDKTASKSQREIAAEQRIEPSNNKIEANDQFDTSRQAKEQEITKESIGASDDKEQTNDNIIEELNFADAAETDIQKNKDTEAKLYCLDSTKVESEKNLLIESCARISRRLASVSMKLCESAELLPTGCNSVDGFPVLLSEFAPIANKEPRGRVLVVGGMHGDELTSVSMVFRWIASLNQFHSGLFHWHMVPMMNPDGVLNSSATRTNKNGVDLNRNLPSDDWQVRALKYWKEKVGSKPRRYPGESPASEPETQWLIDEINTFKPDAIISVHAPYGVVDYDALVLNSAPKSLGKLHLNLLGTYPGSLGNYAGINRNIPVITLELPHSWVMPSQAESAKIWEDIVRWLRLNINNEEATTSTS